MTDIKRLMADNERLRTRYDSATDQAVRYAAEIERLTAALLDIGERAHSPIDDDHIWMDKRTTLGLYIDSLALENKP